MTYLNSAAYKFIKLDELATLRTTLKSRLKDNLILGTILLSPEGINIMLSGRPESIDNFKDYLHKDPRFSDLQYKESVSDQQTFGKLLVKIKKEVIAFGIETIDPIVKTAAYIKPKDLKKLLASQQEVVLLDTRNDYEIKEGSFSNALDLNIKHFKDFPQAAKNLDPSLKNKVIVTFCTGGIRCEKAALLLEQYGFEHVYQLEGGILNYFQECGDSHYQGACYVFDERHKIPAPAESSQQALD